MEGTQAQHILNLEIGNKGEYIKLPWDDQSLISKSGESA